MTTKIKFVARYAALTIALLTLLTLAGCGVGKFFIERAITGMQANIADEISDYADFTPAQEQRIDALASDIATWVTHDRLPAMVLRLKLMADDIESKARLSEATWASTLSFLENPMQLSNVDGAVESVALLVHGMSDEQIEDTLEKMADDHQEAESEYQDFDFADQNKEFAKGLKTVFSEIGISRSRAQIARAREMLGLRQSHNDAEWHAQEKSHRRFIALIADRSLAQTSFVSKFTLAWKRSERGVKELAPEAWAHNAHITYETLNYLLEDLSVEERATAAENVREYADLFTRLSK